MLVLCVATQPILDQPSLRKSINVPQVLCTYYNITKAWHRLSYYSENNNFSLERMVPPGGSSIFEIPYESEIEVYTLKQGGEIFLNVIPCHRLQNSTLGR